MMCGLNDLFRGSSIVFARRTQHGDYVSGLCSVFKATDELVEALEAKHFDTHGGQSSGSN